MFSTNTYCLLLYSSSPQGFFFLFSPWLWAIVSPLVSVHMSVSPSLLEGSVSLLSEAVIFIPEVSSLIHRNFHCVLHVFLVFRASHFFCPGDVFPFKVLFLLQFSVCCSSCWSSFMPSCSKWEYSLWLDKSAFRSSTSCWRALHFIIMFSWVSVLRGLSSFKSSSE